MEKNTVLLDLEKYNELRDFKEKIQGGKTLVIEKVFAYGQQYSNFYFYTLDDVVAEFSRKNKELKDENCELNRKLNASGYTEPKEISISDLKKMNYFEFRKWKKSIK